jgi:hypothetical protein
MDVETNAPASAEAETNTLEMIQELRGAEKTPESESVSNETTTPTEVSNETKPDEKIEPASGDEAEAEARRTALLREIAMDPVATQNYAQQQYYAPQQQTTHTPPVTVPDAAQAPALPFDEFSFDPGNPEHQKALINAQLHEQAAPIYQMLERITSRFDAEDQQSQARQITDLRSKNNHTTLNLLDTYVPGIKGMVDRIGQQQELTPTEDAVFNKAVNLESAQMQGVAYHLTTQYQGLDYGTAYEYVLNNTNIRAQIAQAVGPELKKYASALGLVAQPGAKTQLTPEQKLVMKQESYVESSNAVPANTANSFEKALKSRDTLGMIHELRKSRS